MKKMEKPRKPLIFYYAIVLVVMILLNTLLFPRLMGQEVTQVDYGTFLTMLADRKVAVAQVEQEERNLMSREELENQIATLTGGRAAEELAFHSITTGASNDIEKATKVARAMVARYGMTEDFDMVALETVTDQYMGGDASLACAPETSARIDQMVVDIVKDQHEKARKLLKDNEGKLHELSKYLCEKETITGEEFMRILEKKG